MTRYALDLLADGDRPRGRALPGTLCGARVAEGRRAATRCRSGPDCTCALCIHCTETHRRQPVSLHACSNTVTAQASRGSPFRGPCGLSLLPSPSPSCAGPDLWSDQPRRYILTSIMNPNPELTSSRQLPAGLDFDLSWLYAAEPLVPAGETGAWDAGGPCVYTHFNLHMYDVCIHMRGSNMPFVSITMRSKLAQITYKARCSQRRGWSRPKDGIASTTRSTPHA